MKIIECEIHGKMKWEEDIACENCGRVYLHESEFPEDCACGVRLAPHSDKAIDFSARAICSECAGRARSLKKQEKSAS